LVSAENRFAVIFCVFVDCPQSSGNVLRILVEHVAVLFKIDPQRAHEIVEGLGNVPTGQSTTHGGDSNSRSAFGNVFRTLLEPIGSLVGIEWLPSTPHEWHSNEHETVAGRVLIGALSRDTALFNC
jgi:hypothetical protein